MIETERLILRHWQERDIDPCTVNNSDPKVMEFLGPLRTREETAMGIAKTQKYIDDHGYGLYAAELKETGMCIGYIGCAALSFDAPFTPTIEVGWRIGAQYWGRGYAPEGARAVLGDMFTRLGHEEIISITAVINTKSIRVMQKIGMHTDPRENFNHPKLAIDNPLRPHVLYRMKKKEWISGL
jgi:RimJ/RimL family protein N-acetyltransferase